VRELSLSPLTLLPCTPLEHLDVAVETGFTTVGLRVFPVVDTDLDVLADPDLMQAIVSKISASRLKVQDIEVVRIGPGTDIDAMTPALDFAALVQARRLAVTSEHPHPNGSWDETGVVAKLTELADAAARRGIGVMLEFMAFRSIATLGDAVRIAESVGRSNFGITVDFLHLHRSGGTADDLLSVDPRLFACAQLCDAPLIPPQNIAAEARSDRLYPGEGDLPLIDYVRALPPDLPMAVEVPCRSARDASLRDRAITASRTARDVLNLARRASEEQGIYKA
jgi:sugar phosphate isomerase/epimerase